METAQRDQPVAHATTTELEAGLDWVRGAPQDGGILRLIAARPAENSRAVLAQARLDLDSGLVGDNWAERARRAAPERPPQPDRQLTIMNHRMAILVAGEDDRIALAGDQLYVDLDLSHDNLPAGTRLAIGAAVVEITAPPHRGCAKFTARFGSEAMSFVNSAVGSRLRLRGANARVVVAGPIAVGDSVRKQPAADPIVPAGAGTDAGLPS